MKKIISWARSGILFLILFAFVCAMLISSQAFSAERSIARLTDFSGTVLIKSQGSWGVEPEEGLPLYSDDKIVTKIGIATVTFNDGAVIEINPNSNLLIEESEEEETGIGEKISGLKRRLRLFLGKMSFRTARGSDTKTSLATSTMVCGLRGTAGTLSIGADGQTYLQFTEGGGDTIGDFISGVAADVPTELANLSPAQRAAFVAAAAAEQAKQAQEKLASGEITDADAVYAAAQAAEAAAQEAKAAAEAMMNNPDPDIQAEAAAAIAAADAAIAASQEAQEQAVESGATPGAAPPQEGEAEIGFDVEVTDYSKGDLLEEDDRRMADTYPPVILLSLKPQTITHLSEALFEFSIDDNTSDIDKILVSYKLDGGDVVELEPPDEETIEELGDEPYFYTIDFSGLSEKPHQLIIIAVDEENNTATKSYTWTTDYTAPVALIPTKPADIANTSSFGFDATDTNKSAGITYQYSLDGGAWTSTPAALNLSLAATEGTPYTISVKATDAAGNTGTAVSYTWIYDTIAPVASIPTTPAAFANTSSFGFSATDVNLDKLEYSLDGGAWTATSTTLNLGLATDGTKDGSHNLAFKATDKAGNVSIISSYTWTYDTIVPVASIPTTPAAFANTSSFGFSATDVNLDKLEYSLDGGAWTATSTALNLGLATDGTKDGSHNLAFKATDKAGNVSIISSYTWTYDTIVPTIELAAYPEGGAATVTASYTNTEPGTVSYDYGAANTGLVDGDYSWTVDATDEAGNISTTPFTFSLSVSTLEGSVYGTGSIITGYGYGGAVAVDGQDWGGWEIDMEGEWEGAHDGPLSLLSGGYSHSYGGYWLSKISGSIDTSTGAAAGSSDFTQLTPTSLSKGTGTFTGTFTEIASGIWEGTETGSGLVDTPLAFGGSWGGASIYDNVEGDLYGIGGEGGIFGILTAPADGPAEFLAIGDYGGDFGYPENNEVYLLNSDIWSDELLNGEEVYGLADGYAGGFLEWEAFTDEFTYNGNIALVWYDSYGNAGFLTDEYVSGIFYPGIWMWEADGILTPDVIATVDPSSIDDGRGYIDVTLAGSFAGDLGEIHNYASPGHTTFLYDYTGYVDLAFGVYNLKSGSSNSYYGKPPGLTEWSADIGGYGQFGYGGYSGEYGYWLGQVAGSWSAESANGDGTIDGTLDGVYLTNIHKGVIGGPFYGLYDAYPDGYGEYYNYGTWVGESVGTYEGEPLAWSEHGYGAAMYNDYGMLGYGGYIEGLAGGVDGFPPSDFFAMGETYGGYGGYGGSVLWNFVSYGGPVSESEYGYGGIIDVSGGFAREPDGETYGILEGDLVGIYLTETGEAGFFTGGLSGRNYFTTYSDTLWMLSGGLIPVQKETGVDPSPLELMIIDEGGLNEGGLIGDFDGSPSFIEGEIAMGMTAFLYDWDEGTSLPWGIYDVMLGIENEYYNPGEEEDWSGIMGGYGIFGYGGYYGDEEGRWLASVSGEWDPAAEFGEFTGIVGAAPGTETPDMFGYYITPYQKGNIWGDLYGVNDTEYYDGYGGGWVAKSIGQFEGERLAWSESGYGAAMYNDYGWLGYGGYIEGLAGGVDGFPPQDFFAMGETYGGYGGYGGSVLWNFISYGGPVSESEYGYGGIIDVSGGFAREPDGETYGILEGDLVGIYLTETGDAGFFMGGLSGRNYFTGDSDTVWMLSGNLTSEEPKASGLDPYFIDIWDGFITASLLGDFEGEGWIDGEYHEMIPPGRTWFLYDWNEETSLPWGIYDVMLGDFNFHYNPYYDTEWSGIIGGDGIFGYGGSYYGDEYGMWLASVSGDWTPGGELTGDVGAVPENENTFGYYITAFQMGNIWGELYGVNDDEEFGGYGGGWVAKSIGQFEGEPLDFGGNYYSSLLYNDYGDIERTGWPDGHLGLTDNGDGTYDLLAMGDYSDWGYGGLEGGYGGPYVWSGSLYGYQVVDGGYGGYGGVVGFTTGFWQKDSPDADTGGMDGHAAVIYYTDEGEVGLMSGDLLGDFYEMTESGYGGMFLTQGVLTTMPMETPEGYEPDTESVYENFLAGDLAGRFEGSSENTIFGEYYRGKTKFITYDSGDESLPWGIYNLKLGYGGAFNYYWNKPLGDVMWSADIGGYGGFGHNEEDIGVWVASIGSTWSEGYGGAAYGTIDGTLTGRYLTGSHIGIIEGLFYGQYDADYYGYGGYYTDYGTWIGVSVGTYDGEPLVLSGYLDDMQWDSWYAEYTDLCVIEGLMGVTEDMDVTFMGYHDLNTPLWAMGTEGGAVDDDGTYIVALLDFSSSGNELMGNAVGMYMGDDGYGGFLNYSDLTGTYYPCIGMWDADGTLTLGDIENPAPGSDELMEDVISGEITIQFSNDTFEAGTMGGYGGILGNEFYFDDQDWGITRFLAHGYYEVAPDEEGYWLAPGIGTFDSDGYGGYFNLYYLTESAMGSFSGEMYTDNPASWAYSGNIEQTTPDGVAYWGEEEGGDSLHFYGDYAGDDYGLIGIVDNGDDTFDYLAMGEYEYDPYGMGSGVMPYLWASNIYDDFERTEILGFTGGIWSDGEMDGKVLAVFETESSAGILTGDLTGNFYETYLDFGYGGVWMAEGSLDYIQITDTAASGEGTDFGAMFPMGYGGFDAGGYIDIYSMMGYGGGFDSEDWGVFGMTGYGGYGGSTSNDWWMSLAEYSEDGSKWIEVIGTQWDDDEVAGKVAGAWVDVEGVTGVLGGELKGTFDPMEWQAVAAGAWLETRMFLDMANPANTAGNEALEALNIPYIEIGRTDLTGSGGNLTEVNMNDVTFFAYSDGAMPRIWATGAVNGTTTTTIAVDDTATLTGTGFSGVDFTVTGTGGVGGNWDASVDGSGNVGGYSIDIQGGAAGTIDTPTTFSGTGAGVARPD